MTDLTESADGGELPEPFYQDDQAVIFNADCREILPLLNPLDYATLVTDPPYGMAYESNWPGTLPRSIDGDHDTELRDSVLAWWGSGRAALVFGTWKVDRPPSVVAQLIYDKGGATGMGDLSIPWKPSHEEIYVLGRGWIGTRDCGSVLQGRVQAMAANGREHPHEKDPRTLRQLIEKCPPGVILDPFMGVGTTLRGAKDAGRRAVGIEINSRYCEAAVRRLGQEVLAA
jgi:DNA modification methylase